MFGRKVAKRCERRCPGAGHCPAIRSILRPPPPQLPPSAGAIGSALDLLEARAQFDAPQRAIYVRIAEHDGCTYLDLADELWRAVKISPDGREVISRPPVRFRRAAGMLPLAAAARG
jgi:hypothetical protein